MFHFFVEKSLLFPYGCFCFCQFLLQGLLGNESLRSIAIDENGSTLTGFESIRAALRTNFSLRRFVAPLTDYVALSKLPPPELASVRTALDDIARLVARNHAPAARYEHERGDDDANDNETFTDYESLADIMRGVGQGSSRYAAGC